MTVAMVATMVATASSLSHHTIFLPLGNTSLGKNSMIKQLIIFLFFFAHQLQDFSTTCLLNPH